MIEKAVLILLGLSLLAQPCLAKTGRAEPVCANINGKLVQVKTNMTLPAGCTLTDTRFVFENVQNVSLDLNGSTLTSRGLASAVNFLTSNPQNPTRNVTVKNGTIQGYGTALFINRVLTSEDLQALRANPQSYYPYIQQTATSRVTIDNLRFIKPQGSAIYIWTGNNRVTIKNTYITEAQGPAITLGVGSFGNVVVDNVIVNSGYLDSQGRPREGRGMREAIAVDGSYDNRIARNTMQGNARGGVHLYSNCGEKFHTDPNYVPRIFDAERNLIRNNLIKDNGPGGAVEIGKRVDWNLEDWDCAKPVYARFLTFKYYWDNSGYNRVEGNRGNGSIDVRTDNNTILNNAQRVDVDSVVRRFKGDSLTNNTVSP